MIIRLYTGDDGQAHFENLNVPAGETETVSLKPDADMTWGARHAYETTKTPAENPR